MSKLKAEIKVYTSIFYDGSPSNKRLNCVICAKQYVDFIHHMKNYHENAVYMCGACGIFCTSGEELDCHIERCCQHTTDPKRNKDNSSLTKSTPSNLCKEEFNSYKDNKLKHVSDSTSSSTQEKCKTNDQEKNSKKDLKEDVVYTIDLFKTKNVKETTARNDKCTEHKENRAVNSGYNFVNNTKSDRMPIISKENIVDNISYEGKECDEEQTLVKSKRKITVNKRFDIEYETEDIKKRKYSNKTNNRGRPRKLGSNSKQILIKKNLHKEQKLVTDCENSEQETNTMYVYDLTQLVKSKDILLPDQLQGDLCVAIVNSSNPKDPQTDAIGTFHEGSDRPFLCISCPKGFRKKEHLERHASIHTAPRKHQCKHCNDAFRFYSHYRQHMLTSHSEKLPKMQLSKKAEKLNLKCERCNRTFASEKWLKRHDLFHQVHECDICHAKCRSLSALVDHKRMHFNHKPYACETCGVKFKRKSHLNTHKTIHTGVKPFQCNICGKFFRINSSLNRHIRDHQKAAAKRATMREKNPEATKQHNTAAIPQLSNLITEIVFACGICQLTFGSEEILEKHLKVHEKQEQETIFELTNHCMECGVSFLTLADLKRHQMDHMKGSTTAVSCEICGENFSCESELLEHSSIHTGLLSHKCEPCGLEFSYKSYLQSHTEEYHGSHFNQEPVFDHGDEIEAAVVEIAEETVTIQQDEHFS